MSSEAQQLTWQGQGLPSDDLSAQNALAILHGVMTPLVIDPSSQVRQVERHICFSCASSLMEHAVDLTRTVEV
jgi:dynein heavy chain 2